MSNSEHFNLSDFGNHFKDFYNTFCANLSFIISSQVYFRQILELFETLDRFFACSVTRHKESFTIVSLTKKTNVILTPLCLKWHRNTSRRYISKYEQYVVYSQPVLATYDKKNHPFLYQITVLELVTVKRKRKVNSARELSDLAGSILNFHTIWMAVGPLKGYPQQFAWSLQQFDSLILTPRWR